MLVAEYTITEPIASSAKTQMSTSQLTLIRPGFRERKPGICQSSLGRPNTLSLRLRCGVRPQ